MATILLSAAGAALGGAVGGSVLGLSAAVLGRAAGATLGQVIDQRLLGSGSAALELGRLDRYRLTGASEGTPIAQVWGQMRVGGQVIWATRFREGRKTAGAGKGGGSGVTTYSYSVSLAIALCEGPISGVGRIWADGAEIAPGRLNLRVYPGGPDQMPDPLIEAVEGAGRVPAYRGLAYVVIEDLPLAGFGNRVPQFSFEVTRPVGQALADRVQAVALIPGSGEYALATEPLWATEYPGRKRALNVNADPERADFAVALEQLRAEAPNVASVSLVVSWFGTDLRCGSCEIRPRAEPDAMDADRMPWRVGGQDRQALGAVPVENGRPIYGGTTADAAVIQAIRALQEGGQGVVFYPFVLMEQMAGNTLPDPWTGGTGQPALPWRGRITASVAPGQPGTPDRTAAVDAEVAAFFGAARVEDFTVQEGQPVYQGPQDWGYRRFILHYAHLCRLAGGVDAFCIGSELRGLTQLRGAQGFPAVAALVALAADVRAVLGPAVRIGYAADWTEYFGYHPQDGSGDVLFHLDPLWADPNIDFIGIDNYMPLSDWRDGPDHADRAAGWSGVHDPAYLMANIEGGEGYDWYYPDDAARLAQRRVPISDGAHAEPWVWRLKDIRNWWSNPHHDRINGQRQDRPSPWVPMSKPVWFTELGCGAVDKGTNQPNRFVDPKSSESGVPYFSDGTPDETVQAAYLEAMFTYWADAAHNPTSPVYGGPMVDMARAHVWAWDARPFPAFPGRVDLWSDGANWQLGHWVSGRLGSQDLGAVVAAICARAGVGPVDVSGLRGRVRGYRMAETGSARAALQPLMLAHGFDVAEREGTLRFAMRGGDPVAVLDPGRLADTGDPPLSLGRADPGDLPGRLRLSHVVAGGAYEIGAVEAVHGAGASDSVAQSEAPLVLTRAEARDMADRWLAEARSAGDTLSLVLPPSRLDLGPGDIVELPQGVFRLDRVERGLVTRAEAVRVLPAGPGRSRGIDRPEPPAPIAPLVPVSAVFLDLPLMNGAELPHAPHLAVGADPWPGAVAVHMAPTDAGYRLDQVIETGAILGRSLTPLAAARPGLWDRGAPLRVQISGGALQSVEPEALLAGANLMAIGDGSPERWELFQFAQARLVGPALWDLEMRLRGQAGSDALMPDLWPEGSIVVLMDGALVQPGLAATARGQTRHYRIAPAEAPLDAPSALHRVAAFRGVGLRPYAPTHLRLRPAGGALDFSWIRRSRIDADGWDAPDVPLGEESEAYLVQVLREGAVLREATVSLSRWHYDAAAREADGPGVTLRVAQLSQRFGAGPFARMVIDD